MSFAPFADHREAAMAILNSGAPLSRKEGQFCGGCAFDPNPLSEKQIRSLLILVDRHAAKPADLLAADRGSVIP